MKPQIDHLMGGVIALPPFLRFLMPHLIPCPIALALALAEIDREANDVVELLCAVLELSGPGVQVRSGWVGFRV